MRAIPFDLRARFNLLFVLQQYLPNNRTIAERKDAVRRCIAEHVQRQGKGRILQVERVADLSRSEFRRRFLQNNLPVILEGAAADWPCSREWSFDAFNRRFGNETIKVTERHGTTEEDLRGQYEITEKIIFRDLLHAIQSGGRRYLRFSPLLEQFPELLKDLDEEFLQTWAPGNLGIAYLLFIGGQGSGTPLHNEMTPLLLVNICGVKRWTLIPNGYMAIFNPTAHGFGYNHSDANLEKMDLENFPGLDCIDRMEAVLRPGDILFQPAWAWHTIRNETPHIGVRCGLMHPASMITSSFTHAWVRLFAARNPSIFEVLYKVAFKKHVPQDQWLTNPRIYWRFASRPRPQVTSN